MIETIATEQGAAICKITTSGNHTATGAAVELPGSGLRVLQVRCAKGMLFCGIFDKTFLTDRHIPAAVFSAPSFDEMMKRKPNFLTDEAKALGANLDMTGEQIVDALS